MKKSFILSIMALALVACGNNTKKTDDGQDCLADTLAIIQTQDTIVDAGDGKHTEEYIRQRIDSIYCYVKQQVRQPDNYGVYVNYCDSLYCSESYNTLTHQGKQLSLEMGYDGYLLGYNHWIVGQDFSLDWNYEIKKIDHITDSTAVVELNVHNGNRDTRVALDLVFERNNWYIDDFRPFYPDSKEPNGSSDRAEIIRQMKYYKDNPLDINPEYDNLKKAQKLEGSWGWVGDDTPELLLRLELTDEGFEVTECNVYRLYSFDNAHATFDGETLLVVENYSPIIDNSEKWLELHLQLDEKGDLKGQYKIKHPLSDGLKKGTITLRKDYFKYRDEVVK